MDVLMDAHDLLFIVVRRSADGVGLFSNEKS